VRQAREQFEKQMLADLERQGQRSTGTGWGPVP
jgi:hypothetical protein